VTAPRENPGRDNVLGNSVDARDRVNDHARATLRQLADFGADLLGNHGVPNARNNAEWILCEAADCGRLQIYLDDAGAIPARVRKRYITNLKRRANREPLQYVLGSTEFMSLPFCVPRGVFVPRPDTEILVEEAEQRLRAMPLSPCLRVLDLCCGSGVIAVSLARGVANLEAWAVDSSSAAVNATRMNAKINGVRDRIHVVNESAERFVRARASNNPRPTPTPIDSPRHFGAVVCNPPYIVTGDIPELPPEVRDHEPVAALDGGPDGLDFYRRLVPFLLPLLEPAGFAAFEIGETQGAAVAAMMEASGFAGVSVTKDLSGRQRVVAGSRPV
jgi:release factor glutamine methyltransferase